MDAVSSGFWGAFFGTVCLMLAGSLVAFARSQHRAALMSGLSAIVSALFVTAYLGWLPLGGRAIEARVLAHIAMASAAALGLMLLSLLGLLRQPASGRRAARLLVACAAAAALVGWALEPREALVLSSAVAFGMGAFMLALCVLRALRNDRLAWLAVAGVSCMLVAIVGLTWIAMARPAVGWPVHAATALSSVAYLTAMASALWVRYSYLIELREVMAHGPAYDPVTRMRSHTETGQMVGLAFFRGEGPPHPVGVIVVSISNLYALENLHGRAAANHALFVCAGRLRHSVPVGVDMGRLADDGFLLLVRRGEDLDRLLLMARTVRERLARPVALGTSRDPAQLEVQRTDWVADAGIGVLVALPRQRPSDVIAMARAMSRTAWTYPSRLAWVDPVTGRISELPGAEGG